MKMKKKLILSAAGVVLLAASVTTFVCTNKSNDPMADLFKANVEALTRSERGGSAVMCSQTDNPGTIPMKSCKNCDGEIGSYAMDKVAFCF